MFASLKDKVGDLVRVKMSKSEYVQLFAEVCTDEAWGPTVPEMDKLVHAYPNGYYDILPEIQLRFDSRKENWRRCYKSLLILDHFARTLEHRFLDDLRSFMPTLKEMSNSFYYTDEKGVDRGMSVRERAKKVIDLLTDTDLLEAERAKSEKARQATGGGSGGGGGSKYAGFGSGSSENTNSGGSGSGSTNRYGGSGSSGRYQGFSSESNTSPEAMEAQQHHTHSAHSHQDNDDIAFARRLQEEEDARARSHHQPTSTEIYKDHEIAKRMAGDAPQNYLTSNSNNSSRTTNTTTNHSHHTNNKTTTSGSSSSGGGNQVNLFANFQGAPNVAQTNNNTQQQQQQQKSSGTNLDDIFGGGGNPSTSSNNNQKNDIFGNASQPPAPINTNNNNNNSSSTYHQTSDPFGAFVGSSPNTGFGATGTSSSSNSTHTTTTTTTTSSHTGGNNKPASSGSDAFACLAGLAHNAPTHNHNANTSSGSNQQHHSTAQTSATVADIFGAPSPSTDKPKNNDFPF